MQRFLMMHNFVYVPISKVSALLVSLSSGTTTTSSGTSLSIQELRTSVSLLSRCGHLTYCFTTGMLHTLAPSAVAAELTHHCIAFLQCS